MGNRRNPNRMGGVFLAVLFSFQFALLTIAATALFSPIDNHLISCGAPSSVALDDRRLFVPDCPASSDAVRLSSHGPRVALRNPSPDAGSPLQATASVFTRLASYEFEIRSKGTHLVRLHFYPFSAPNFNLSSVVFHVLASNYVLLSNFSTAAPLLKEYLIHLEEGKFVITFSPAEKSSFAFVSAIEVVSAPKDLILGSARLVKADGVDDVNGLQNQAMETMYRINVGGQKVTPFNDTLWRTWLPDSGFLQLGSASSTVKYGGQIKYTAGGASREVAPDNVYNTARVVNDGSALVANHSMAWEFPIILGHKYLIRMHFCDISSRALNELFLNVYLNGYLAYEDFDISSNVNLLASPYYIDFVIDAENSESLSVSIGPSKLGDPSWIHGLLNGLEIMKINNTNGNLDGNSQIVLASENPIGRGFWTFLRSVACGFAFVSLLLIAFMLFLRLKVESRIQNGWSRLPTDVSDGHLAYKDPVVSGKISFSVPYSLYDTDRVLGLLAKGKL